MIQVVGGCYFEVCLSPAIKQFYGSGGRAAAMLASSGVEVRLHTFVNATARSQIRRLAALSNITIDCVEANQSISFAYVSPVMPPIISPNVDSSASLERTITASGEMMLCFGMLEGGLQVDGGMVVYDPQNGQRPRSFRSTGSKAKRLAVVCNSREAIGLIGRASPNNGFEILKQELAEVVVIKNGAAGAVVYTEQECTEIPAHYSETVFSIGSGDVFAAAFTYAWAHLQLGPIEAARWASQAVAYYACTRQESFPSQAQRALMRPLSLISGRIYLAGPFFNMSQRWLIEQTRSVFSDMGLEIFSPLHDVGYGDADAVASGDLAGLRQCDRVFAILDGLDAGTMFEIGFARAINIPVYVYTENVTSENSKMVAGSGCQIINDYTTAIYHTAWRL